MASSLKEQHLPIEGILSGGSSPVDKFKPTVRERTGGIKKMELHVSTPNGFRGRDSPNVYRHTGTSTMKSEVGTET